jgi:hypothetical protein
MLDGLNDALDSELQAAQLLDIGHAAVTMIALRNKAGVDVDGKPFAPYSQSYTKVRREAGLSTTRDLVRKGHMIGALTPTVTGKNEVTIGFQNAQEELIASVHNFGGGRQKQSEFMDIRSNKELAALAEMIGEDYALNIEKKLGK